ncbi:MAG: exodeoxyribonuclease III [Bacteroidales bacterium]|nr:exodeoxyribonuclease III [Bacteroidales bacterium]
MKKIISYNVNGLRAAIKKDLLNWFKQSKADIICLQETKAQPEQLPVDEIESAGYHSYWFSAEKKGYSGVSFLLKQKPDNIEYGMGIDIYDKEGRVIRADYGDISILNVYHPSGSMGAVRQAFKMQWLEDFNNYIKDLKEIRPNLIITGDFNICHKPIDIHDPIGNAGNSGFLPEEREWIDKFMKSGFIDSFRHFNKEPHNYTWWSYRTNARERNLGWRIDYIMISENIKDIMQNAAIYSDAVHSDHCPISLIADF